MGLNEPVLTKTPPANAANLLADYVGYDILPASYWLELLADTGFTDIISKEYQVELLKESRSQMGFYTTIDFINPLGNKLKMIIGRVHLHAI